MMCNKSFWIIDHFNFMLQMPLREIGAMASDVARDGYIATTQH